MSRSSTAPEVVSAEFAGGVAAWRRDRLLSAGFDRDLAVRLAADPAADLHAVLALVDRGCAPMLAARILEPIDGWRRWSR
jgi:hypothetical protein